MDEFLANHLRRAPVARPRTALVARELLSWEVLDRVLRAGPDVLVVARGQLLEARPPRSLAELRAQLDAGIGLCVRHTERHDPGLAQLAACFHPLGDAQVQVFVTPGGSYGFGWHYDDEDVFIAQTAGAKEYYFRANTVAADVPARPRAFARFHDETSPLCAATLLAGDFLYVPSRWWHMATCQDDALSISVGVRTRPVTSSIGAPDRP
jgi:50S ribosomal protein L16 3-hydroxylase